ncbi:MAG: UbiD family decarboxylase [Candidatus Thalassarchaeaceae archaeon]|nr:UbiD family decarboxylase [Candidatus Thalassarchaeaceae archaeon]
MAFRDHLDSVPRVSDEISCIHGILEHSNAVEHAPFVATSILEAPSHSVAANILSRDRLCAVLGINPGELIDILGEAMDNRSDPSIVENGPVFDCKQSAPMLTKLPIPWHYPNDRGRYMSASIVIAEYGGQRNVSFHRQFVRDDGHVVARLVPRHLRTMVDTARNAGEEIPIAIVNGADPVVLLAAAMSFNEAIDELTVASSLHEKFYGRPLELVKLPNGIVVPADSEYAMSAFITCDDDLEAPYVDITGTLDDERMEPVFRITEIYHRKNPIFHALIPALSEHITLMGLPRAPTIKSAVSEVVECHDVHMTVGGCGWLSSVISITPKNPDDGKKAIHAAFNGHKSMKMVTVVNQDIDVANSARVEWALMTRWQPDVDTVILSKQKGSSLDPSRGDDGLTAKIGYDATLDPNSDPGPFTSVL